MQGVDLEGDLLVHGRFMALFFPASSSLSHLDVEHISLVYRGLRLCHAFGVEAAEKQKHAIGRFISNSFLQPSSGCLSNARSFSCRQVRTMNRGWIFAGSAGHIGSLHCNCAERLLLFVKAAKPVT